MRRRLAAPVLATMLAFSTLGSPTGASASTWTKLTDVRVAMDDAVRLAADVYVPTVADADGDGLYPCVVELTPYRKESRHAEGSSYLPGAGIALIEVDARGTGGSEGEYDIVFSVREQRDMAQWIDWAALSATKDGKPVAADGSNKLCEETVGTYGGSYSGIIQYLVASLPLAEGDAGFGRLPLGSRYLAATAPQRAYGDLYRDIVYHGGIVIGSFGLIWAGATTAFYTQPPTDVSAPEGQAAWSDHLTKNDSIITTYLSNPYSDAMFTSNSTESPYTQRLYEDSSVLSRMENLRVPTLHLAGFFDAFTRGQLRTFQEAYALEKAAAPGARGPNFLIAGPWNHSGTHFITPDQGFKTRLGDWYRYWLEGKANGAEEPAWFAEPRVRYFQTTSGVINAQSPSDGEWRTATDWPPPDVVVQRLYLQPSNLLSTVRNHVVGGDSGTYVYTPSAGAAELVSRWDNAALPTQLQLDQRLEYERGLSFTTATLNEPLKVTGPIAMRLLAGTVGLPGVTPPNPEWPGSAHLSPPYHDTDFVVKVSDVRPDGSAMLVTAGYLRASHRAVDGAKSQFVGGINLAPYHPATLASLDPPPADGTLRPYDIEIWPVAKTWPKGHRLRIEITSSDTPNHLTLLKPAVNSIAFGGAGGGSYIDIPVGR